MEKRKVLVSGATGQQGGSVIKALLKEGHQVIGITRNIEAEKAQKLSSQGVRMVSVNFTDFDALVALMKTVDTVFSMTTPFEGGLEYETEQGITMANAAIEAGVGHFIFNSVGDADKNTNVPHFDSKYAVEKHLEAIGLPYTIVAPVYFMDNLFYPHVMDTIKAEGILKMAMPAERVLQQISVEDIGKFVAAVVNERENMFGKRINIAGDELTGNEMVAIISKVVGKEITYEGFSPDYMREQSADMAAMFQWFIDKGYTADVAGLKKYGLSSFETWAKNQDWSLAK